MKNRIKQKLTSSDGISVLFGLLFFLVAAILSAVMLSASVTAIKSVTSDHKTEQNYQTCASAAATIRDAITGTTVTEIIETKTTQTGNSSKKTTTTTSTSWSVTVKNNNAKNFAETYLKDWLESMVNSSNDSKQTTLTISGVNGLDDVTANMTIKKDGERHATIDGTDYPFYDIDIVFTSGTGVDTCKLNLTLSGKCSGKTESSYYGSQTTTTTIDYTWDGANIMYGDETKEAGS